VSGEQRAALIADVSTQQAFRVHWPDRPHQLGDAPLPHKSRSRNRSEAPPPRRSQRAARSQEGQVGTIRRRASEHTFDSPGAPRPSSPNRENNPSMSESHSMPAAGTRVEREGPRPRPEVHGIGGRVSSSCSTGRGGLGGVAAAGVDHPTARRAGCVHLHRRRRETRSHAYTRAHAHCSTPRANQVDRGPAPHRG